MQPEDDTDPTPHSGPASTDPIFPPKLGRAGQKPVSVTAVQGPGVNPANDPEPKDPTTTEQLLSGLLQSPDAEVRNKQENKKRKRESSGEEAAAYNVSPRPVPVAHKEGASPELVVAPTSDPEETTAKRHATRDDRTVSLPRKNERVRAIAAFVGALVLVLLAGWLLLRNGDKPTTTTTAPPSTLWIPRNPLPPPTTRVEALPVAPSDTAAPIDTSVTADPVIESQMLKHPRGPGPRPSATAAPSGVVPATTATGSNGLPPDFDELKKGIKH